jgi:hypothetical protein
VLGTQLSALDEKLWDYSYADLRSLLKLKFGYEQAKIIQEYQTLSLLMSAVFGGKKKDVASPGSFEEAAAAFQGLVGGR